MREYVLWFSSLNGFLLFVRYNNILLFGCLLWAYHSSCGFLFLRTTDLPSSVLFHERIIGILLFFLFLNERVVLNTTTLSFRSLIINVWGWCSSSVVVLSPWIVHRFGIFNFVLRWRSLCGSVVTYYGGVFLNPVTVTRCLGLRYANYKHVQI